MKIFLVLTKKKSIFFILLFSCLSASDVVTDVAKQNKHCDVDRECLPQRERKIFRQIKIILILECSLLSNEKMHIHLGSFV